MTTNTVDAVVSDMMMPEMNGYELLRKVKELYPSAARIILSGYSDAKIIQRAVMQGVATAYLLKPLEIEGLTSVLEQCRAIREKLRDENVRNAIFSAGPLPVMSKQQKNVLDLVEADSGIDVVAQEVERDTSISTNILRLANSAFYGHRSTIGSVKDAVVCIGLSAVKSVVCSLSIVDEKNLGREATARIRELQDHSAAVNRLTNALYHKIAGHAVPDTARSVGLVHDIGMFLMEVRMPEKIRQFSAVQGGGAAGFQSRCEKEGEIFGATHAEIGGYLLDIWSFPHICVATALYHHEPIQPHLSKDEQTLMSILHIADRHVWKRGEPPGFMAGFQEADAAYAQIGKSRDDILAIIESLEPEVTGACK